MNTLKKIKEEYHNIKVPEDLDTLIKRSTKKARRQRLLLVSIHWVGLTTITILLISIAFHAISLFG